MPSDGVPTREALALFLFEIRAELASAGDSDHWDTLAGRLLARYDIRERGETQSTESERQAGQRVSAHRLDRIRSVVVGVLLPYDESEGERVRDDDGVVWCVEADSVLPAPVERGETA